jgi:glycosyltransferase involved in cell wall biosynthesis
MGLCGWLVAKTLHIPVLGTYHTDFPAYAEALSGDQRIARGVSAYMQWFYSHVDQVFARSREYRTSLRGLGIDPHRLSLIRPSVDTAKFNPAQADHFIWEALGIRQRYRLLYAGRVSIEKNLPMLAEVFRTLCQTRNDVALVIAGDGPYRATMQSELGELPAYFLGMQHDRELTRLYASSDLLLFPSRTDTLGQAVLEAQASGLVALVGDEGGPQELIDDGITGLVLPAADPGAWVRAIESLLDDASRRQDMARALTSRGRHGSIEETFEAFWAEHLRLAQASAGGCPAPSTAAPTAIDAGRP